MVLLEFKKKKNFFNSVCLPTWRASLGSLLWQHQRVGDVFRFSLVLTYELSSRVMLGCTEMQGNGNTM